MQEREMKRLPSSTGRGSEDNLKKDIILTKPDRTLIMGILNCTPDSFSDGGRYMDREKAVSHALDMISSGADIIDIGGESTRPGFTEVSEEEELKRVIPVVTELAGSSALLSVDTTKAAVAEASVQAGADIINDISGNLKGNRLTEIAAASGAYLVIMFNARVNGPAEGSIMERALSEISANIDHALSCGVKEDRLIIDPGIGFGTTRGQDAELTRNVDKLSFGGRFKVLYAASRKRIVKELFGAADSEKDLDDHSDVLALFAASKGADIIRTHRVEELGIKLRAIDRITGKGQDPWIS